MGARSASKSAPWWVYYLCAVALIPGERAERFKRLDERIAFFRKRRPELIANIFPPDQPGYAGRRLLAICNERKLRRILSRMLDEDRFFSKYGVRALSRWHLDHPYEFDVHGEKFIVQYMPAESQNGMLAATPIGAALSGSPSMC